jgi:hypothetical protein
MTRDPDDDLQRKRMDLALREASIAVHQAWQQKAEHHLDMAEGIVGDIANGRVPEGEVEAAYRLGTLLATQAGAIAVFVQSALMVEAESSNLPHALGHQQHAEEQQAHVDAAAEAVSVAMQEAIAKMREKGIEAFPAPGGFPGIVIRKPDEDPDGPLG